MNFSKKTKLPVALASAVICLLLLITGCAPHAEKIAKPEPEPQMPEAVTLALKFTPEDSTTYRLTTEEQQTLKFEGTLASDADSKGGHSSNKTEMTFTQQIQSIDDEGNAVAKITIKGLKCSSVYRDKPTLNFDSSTEKDRDNPLVRLIGKSYEIEITPAGEVSKIVDARNVRIASRVRFPTSKAAARVAAMLVSSDAIKRRHAVPVLPAIDKNRLRPGDKWSNTKVFPFPLVGSKSYERIYTLKESKSTDGRQIATVEMNAIPSSEIAEQLHEEQAANVFSKMFDNPIDSYTGHLKLDLTAGKVEKYLEKLQSEWVVVDPSVRQQGDKDPGAIRMGTIRLHRLEKVD
ncbi:hypothetical protein ES703_55216 [subsurface metagenome]